MYYQVQRVQRLKAAGPDAYYLLVDCWLTKLAFENGRPPRLTEEFGIQRRAVGRRVVQDAAGFLVTATGDHIDPAGIPDPEPVWLYETFAVDLRGAFRSVIEASLREQLRAGWSGDHTGDPTKPLYLNNVLVPQRADSRPLEGDGVDLALAPPPVEVA